MWRTANDVESVLEMHLRAAGDCTLINKSIKKELGVREP